MADQTSADGDPSDARSRRVALLGVLLDDVDESEVISRILGDLATGRGGWVVTPNVDILRQAVADPSLRDLVNRASLVIPDGMPLVWASRLAGTPLGGRVPASSLVLPLARAMAADGRRLFLLGGEPGVADEAAAVLRGHAPGLSVAGSYAPPPGFESDPAQLEHIAELLTASRADVVLCAFGCPKQERLMSWLVERFPSSWFLGVGGTLTIVSGRTPTAPQWMKRLGMEWLHRLRLEPRRLFHRYVVDDAPFALRLLATSLARRRSSRVDSTSTMHGEPTGRPLRVCLATWDDDPPVGGQGVYMRELRRGLQARGVEVDTVAGRGAFAHRYPRLTGRGHLDLTLALGRSPSVLLAGRPDLVHVSGGPGGIHLLRRLPVPVVYTAHHTYRQAHGWWRPQRWYGLLEAASYRRAAMISTPSPSTAQAVIASGVPAERVRIISPGVRADDVLDNSSRVPGRLLFLGRLEPEKGPLAAIAVMRALAAEVPGAHGHVVGHGSLAGDVIAASDASGGVVTYRGQLTDTEVEQELRQAQVVLVPSAYEGLGIVALEAMAVGACVVAYDVTGLRDSVADAGVLVPFDDEKAMANACRDLLLDDSARTAMAAKALDKVRSERSWERFAEEFERLYREVLAAT